jgi:predicted dehydrogenase
MEGHANLAGMTKEVRMGVVGAGSIAIRGILPHLAMYDLKDRLKLQAVCDPVEGRAEAAAERFGIERAFTTLEELLADGDVDAVSIASPIGLHYEQGKRALEAGKHVHFNKTMTTTVAEATELIELAKKKDLRIVASPGEMLRPHNRFIREQIQQGAIGTLTWAICGAAFGQYHEQEKVRQGDDVLSNVDPSWYFRKPGGGPLYDMTVYALHALTGILGPAKRVTAMSGTRIKEREFRGTMVPTDADDNTLITIDFGDNLYAISYGTAAGRVTASFGANYYGTKGSITELTMNGEPLQYPGWDLAKQAPNVNLGNQRLLPHVVGPHAEEGTQEHHVYEDVMQLVDWVREGKPSIVTAEHARHVIDIIESGYRASETGQTQELKTTFTPL